MGVGRGSVWVYMCAIRMYGCPRAEVSNAVLFVPLQGTSCADFACKFLLLLYFTVH